MVSRAFKLSLDKDGYHRTNLTSLSGTRHQRQKVSRLVALTFVLNDLPAIKIEVDHINGVRNDDRVENLEWVTPREQQRRRAALQRIRGDLSSEYIGITWNTRDNLWYAQVWLNGRRKHIGCFKDEMVAALIYDRYVVDNGLDFPINGLEVIRTQGLTQLTPHPLL